MEGEPELSLNLLGIPVVFVFIRLVSRKKSVKMAPPQTYLEIAMKKSLILAVAALSFSGAAMANVDLAKSKNCLTCHSIDNKVVGPGFKEVAKKYASDKTAETKLVQKVLKGGSGSWGAVPMPANAQVSEAEAKTLVKWVLSLK